MMLWLAWLAPCVLGSGLWALASGRPRCFSHWCAVLGGGWMLGLLLTAWAVGAASTWVSPQQSVGHIAPWLLVLAIIAWVLAWRRPATPLPTSAEPAPARAWWCFCVLLLALLLVRAWWFFDQAGLRPLFPWDAWWVWSVKPKVWYLLDAWVPFVTQTQWIGATSVAFTDAAPAYPELLAYLEVWFASAAGCWCDPAFTVLWPMLWACMLLAGYGLLRNLGVGPMLAFVAVFALGSLPSINTHAVLAGYADLWLAVVFTLTLLSWLQWQQRRDWRALLLALVLGLSLPAIKLEGAVWMFLWLTVLVLGLLPRRWRGWTMLGGVTLVVIGLALGGFSLPVPGLGWVGISADHISVPGTHGFALGWHPILPAVVDILLVQPNWHLLFYVAPPLILWRWRYMLRSPGLGLMGLCLLGGSLFLFLLFFMTDAAAWARNYTSVNRLLLHMVPALVFFLALICANAGINSTVADKDQTLPRPPSPG